MNCEKWQQQILLAESGELTPGDRQHLDVHLASCAACREFRDAAVRLTEAVRPVLRQGTPSAEAMNAIRLEAEARAGKRPPLILRPFAVQVAACAAALVLAIGGWLFLRTGEAPSLDSINQMQSLLSMVSGNDSANGAVSSGSPATDHDARIKALAQDLLRMEGLSID